MRKVLIFGICASVLAGAAGAQAQIELSRAAYVERLSDGGATRTIAPATALRKGDTVVLVVGWRSAGDRKNFTVSSPIPKHLAFKSSSQDRQIVSIDGGRNWGDLSTMKVRNQYGQRKASVEDVTHLRWRIPASHSVRGSGKITYSAIVR